MVRDALTETLSFARQHIPYYQRMVRALRRPPRLSDFPVVSGDVVASEPQSFAALDSVPDIVALTGGTSGQPKYVFYQYEDLESTYCSMTGLSPGERLDPGRFQGVAIGLADMQHGLILPPAHGQPILSLPLEVGRHFGTILHFLQNGIFVRGRQLPVIAIYGSVTKLRALTRYLEHIKLSGRKFAVREIVAFAFHTSELWRRKLAKFWNCRVTEAYGLTEFLGILSRRCSDCDGYHLPDQIVHTELLGEDLATPVTNGLASLVLTSLLPFRKAMPLIRYDTRDLVELLPVCPGELRRGFRFHGRADHVLRLPSDRSRVAVGPRDVLDALEHEDAENPGVIVYDEEVATILSWGLGNDAPDFRGVGYAQMFYRAANGRLDMVVETGGATPRRRLAARLRERISEIARKRHDADVASLISVSAVQKGTLKERRLSRIVI